VVEVLIDDGEHLHPRHVDLLQVEVLAGLELAERADEIADVLRMLGL